MLFRSRALLARRVGRWPLLVWVAWVLVAAFRAGGGNAVRFLVPPELTKALSPPPWRGPSPLPQRNADPWPAGSPKPPASARPRRALACVLPGPAGLGGTVPCGETRCVSGSARNGCPLLPDQKHLLSRHAGGCFSAPCYRLASSAAITAAPMSVVLTGVPPSGPIRSAVRTPSASTCSTAASTRAASAPRSKE